MAGTGFVQMLAPPFGLEAKVFGVVWSEGSPNQMQRYFIPKKSVGLYLHAHLNVCIRKTSYCGTGEGRTENRN